MGTITTLRPSGTSSGVGWTPSTGTLHGVTSDNSDATYATWGGSGSALILTTPIDSPPAGEQRHQIRLRARGEDGDAWWAVRLASGGLVAGAAASFPSSPSTVTGSWGFGAPASGSTILSTYVTGQSTGVRIEELYIDVDSRLAPTFTPQVLDGSGASTVTVSDTAQPSLRANAVDLDGLAARQYRYWVTQGGSTVWDSGAIGGSALTRQVATPLDNGSYVAHFSVWSTLGSNTPYDSGEETLAFTVSVGAVPAPDNPIVDPVPDTPFYELEACAPYSGEFDDDVSYIEIQRVDCPIGGFLELEGGNGYASTPGPPEFPGTSIGILSGEFESNVTGWAATGGSLAQSNAQAHQGTGSALLTMVGMPGQTYFRPNGLGNWPVVTPGRLYRATFWAYSPVPMGGVAAAIDWFDVGVGYLDTSYAEAPIAAATWTKFTVVGEAPVGAHYGIYGPTIFSDSIYIDSVLMEDITPDLQITVMAARGDDWRPADDEHLVSKWVPTGNQASFRLGLDSNGDDDPALAGRPFIAWSEDGTTGAISVGATERMLVGPGGVVTLRVSVRMDDGAGNYEVTFQTWDPDAGEWVQVGEVVTGPASTMFWSTAPIEVGALTGTANPTFQGQIYWAEVRNGATGPIIASPDFRGRAAGTTSFGDDQGNTWTVHVPGEITSDQRLVSIAILGPLETGECATYVDYTLPRTGVGLTCSHQPEPCCSYYRARTLGRIDGALQVSDWSDAYDPGVPPGMIFMWPGTNASIPAGWDRVTDLDGRYPKGVPNSSTDPGLQGGALNHGHTVLAHTHDTSHSHPSPTPTAAATGTVNAPNTGGALKSLTTHTHSRPSTNSATVVSGDTVAAVGDHNNEPDRYEVLFIEPDGTPLGVPDNGAAYMGDIAPSGWSTFATATGSYPKGSTATDAGSGIDPSNILNHTHTLAAHTHTGTSHTHTSANTGNFSATLAPATGSGSVTSAATHNHPITIGLANSQALASGGSANSDSTSPNDPPYRNLRFRQNTSGGESLPVGVIALWRRAIGLIPKFWQFCDGTNGTPDMAGRYVKAATSSIGGTGGGTATHTHTTPTHVHTTTGHSHTASTGVTTAGSTTASTTATVAIATAAHTHALTDVTSTSPTVAVANSGTTSAINTEPLYEEVAFVQLMETPTPPPDPEMFCLTWDDDEQLIRTEGPDGPMWVAVGGKFTWDVDRPFTAAVGLMGGRYVTSSPPGGRNLHMAAAVENEAQLAALQAVLNRPLVLVSPSDANEVWAAPVAASVRIIKIGRIRQVTADFIATGPQPEPQLADVS